MSVKLPTAAVSFQNKHTPSLHPSIVWPSLSPFVNHPSGQSEFYYPQCKTITNTSACDCGEVTVKTQAGPRMADGDRRRAAISSSAQVGKEGRRRTGSRNRPKRVVYPLWEPTDAQSLSPAAFFSPDQPFSLSRPPRLPLFGGSATVLPCKAAEPERTRKHRTIQGAFSRKEEMRGRG